MGCNITYYIIFGKVMVKQGSTEVEASLTNKHTKRLFVNFEDNMLICTTPTAGIEAIYGWPLLHHI